MKNPLFVNPFHKPSDTILVVGAARSGTTWLGNIISSCPGFQVLFEPFDYRRVPQLDISSLKLYIRPNASSHYFDENIRDVLLGKIRNDWILSHNWRKFTWRILIKEIRANLFLGYLKSKFNSRIVYVVRHPCAVVLSRLRLKWESKLFMEEFLKQEKLIEDYLFPFEELIRNSKNELEEHTIHWCVNNLVPLKQLKNGQIIFCAYEHLVENTGDELNRIFGMLGLRIPSKMDQVIKKPSSLLTRPEAVLKRNNLLGNWKTELSRDEIRKILDIVNLFGIDIYSDDIMPNLNCSFLK